MFLPHPQRIVRQIARRGCTRPASTPPAPGHARTRTLARRWRPHVDSRSGGRSWLAIFGHDLSATLRTRLAQLMLFFKDLRSGTSHYLQTKYACYRYPKSQETPGSGGASICVCSASRDKPLWAHLLFAEVSRQKTPAAKAPHAIFMTGMPTSSPVAHTRGCGERNAGHGTTYSDHREHNLHRR